MVNGYIMWFQSESTGNTFPNFVFVADTDMVTVGFATLTSVLKPEIVLAYMTGEEFANDDFTALEDRLNGELGRTDLRAICYDLEKQWPDGRFMLRDIHATGGHARELRNERVEDFLAGGGSIIDRLSEEAKFEIDTKSSGSLILPSL